MDELVTLLAYEATRDVRTEEVEITTPVALARCRRLAEPRPIVVPILRAGLGILEGMTRLLPTAKVGFLGVFEPGRGDDGVSVQVPVEVLGRLEPEGFDWLVAGMRPELCVATIRALLKQVRRQLVPAPDVGV